MQPRRGQAEVESVSHLGGRRGAGAGVQHRERSRDARLRVDEIPRLVSPQREVEIDREGEIVVRERGRVVAADRRGRDALLAGAQLVHRYRETRWIVRAATAAGATAA